MTLIMAVVRDNQCVLTGDYRRTKIDNLDEYYDDVPKVFKVNSNILIGFSGDLGVRFRLGKIINSLITKDTSIDDAAIKISQWLKENTTKAEEQTVIFVGKAEDQQPIIINVSHHNNYEVIRQQGTTHWFSSYCYICPNDDIEKEIDNIGSGLEDLVKLVTVINKKVSNTDKMVSPNCKVLYME
ncbi:hypothetical protein [Bacillus mycoides]|uniref:hypothetical protein n=1 Tax=Bacillus mycoides TaxID=1405 RepID=UPI0011AB1570|nr:hypothetical protein [Bacillus mycoides]